MTATTIVVAQRKGGAGKTTLAAHLGVAWAAMGYRVALIDTDPQASLTRWHQRREARRVDGRTGLGFAATTGWRVPGEILRRARDCDILLVDSAASADIEIRHVMKCAGLVVVPVQPSPVDVWATLSTLELAQREQVPALLVLNRVPARASLTAAMREELARYDVGLAATGIGNRVAFAAAFCDGWGITECAEDSSAAAEIAALAAELSALLPSSNRRRERDGAAVQAALPDVREFSREAPERDEIGERECFATTMDETICTRTALDVAAAVTPEVGGGETLVHPHVPLSENQLLAGIAFLKRRLARRSKQG
ncbi:MAG TPA: ParA family partition ATPase [Stellaceae bacterium]|nr:ParA family partition ATPase [Stellaceae bacterium]